MNYFRRELVDKYTFFISETFLPILYPIKAVETVLHLLLVRAEKTLDQQEKALGFLIDIEGDLITLF
jgi:hypothetical protein